MAEEEKYIPWSKLQREYWTEIAHRMAEGQVVIKEKDRLWQQGEMGLSLSYVRSANWDRVALPFWLIFRQRMYTHSGKHRHQGGLNIFVLEGKGYSVVDGVRYDWEQGDLVILPVKPEGIVHQHFNLDPDKPAEWIAIIFHPAVFDAMGTLFEQIEYHPDYKGKLEVMQG